MKNDPISPIIIPESMQDHLLEIKVAAECECNRMISGANSITGFPGYKWVLLGIVTNITVTYPEDNPHCMIPETHHKLVCIMAKVDLPEAKKNAAIAFEKLSIEAEKHGLIPCINLRKKDEGCIFYTPELFCHPGGSKFYLACDQGCKEFFPLFNTGPVESELLFFGNLEEALKQLPQIKNKLEQKAIGYRSKNE